MPHLMRLNRDVDDFKLTTGDEGDIVLRCGQEGCTASRVYLFGPPDMGTLIADAYEHLDEAHQAGDPQ
jgi:hypothetical protein